MVLTISFQVAFRVVTVIFFQAFLDKKKEKKNAIPMNLDNGGVRLLYSLSLSKRTINFSRLFFFRRRDRNKIA